MNSSLSADFLEKVFTDLRKGNQAFQKLYPGDSGEQQPIHTLYGGAQLFKAESCQKIGELSIKSLKEYAPDAKTLAKALDLAGNSELHETIYQRVLQKLQKEAVEDFRIDFEDGYGNRPDAEEDECAAFTANEVARAARENLLPPFIGIRIKTLSEELKARAFRTLDIFISTLLQENQRQIPPGFVVTLPKVVHPGQVSAFVRVLEELEHRHQLRSPSIKMEIMVETTQSLFSPRGEAHLPLIIAAAQGRCRGAHFGTYDYTAGCDITAAHQKMDHPNCDFALQMMKVTLAGTGIWLSDGATSIMPVPIHRGQNLSQTEQLENQRVVHQAWKLSHHHNWHSMRRGIYQGWDLHPGQIPIRYASAYAFFLEGLKPASDRLRNFMDKAAQATLVGDVFDDAATGQGLLNYFLRALNSGAITEKEIENTGLTLEEVRSKSFVRILKQRREKNAGHS